MLHRIDGDLHIEQVSLNEIKDSYGTPCYVYSEQAIQTAYRAFDEAFEGHPHDIRYAVKANSNLAVLQTLAQLGSGFDIVSGGELTRVLAAGGDDDVLHPIGDAHEALVVDAADIAGVQPAEIGRAHV